MNENEKPKGFKEKLKLYFNRFHIIGTIVGAGGGLLYWWKAGCQTGTCHLKSNPYYMLVMGMAIGYLVADLIFSTIRKRKKQDPENHA
jgi:hypothetical protein